MTETRSRTLQVSEASRPVLPRHAKLRFDETRQLWVILAPRSKFCNFATEHAMSLP
jgi:pyrroloquinoline quinone biosynthesis protein D